MYHVGGLLEYSKRGRVQYRGVPLSHMKCGSNTHTFESILQQFIWQNREFFH